VLSKRLVTIQTDLDVPFDLDAMRLREPDRERLKQLYVELEFHTLAREAAAGAAMTAAATAAPTAAAPPDGGADTSFDFGANAAPAPKETVRYEIVDTVEALGRMVARAREVAAAGGTVAVDTETVIDAGAPLKVDALRSRLVSISVALAPGEAYYLPLAHREYRPGQAELLSDAALPADPDKLPTDAPPEPGAAPDEQGVLLDSGAAAPKKAKARKAAAPKVPEPTGIAGRMLAERAYPVRNLPPLDSPEMRPLVALLEDAAVSKTLQNAKYDLLVLRRAGVALRGVDFDPMLASYVLDPGRRSHGLDMLAIEFLNHSMTSYEDLCGRGRTQLPFDVVPVEAAAEYSCEDADMTLRLRHHFEPQLEAAGLAGLFRDMEVPLVDVLADMEAAGIAIDVAYFGTLRDRFRVERERLEKEIYAEAGEEFNINSNLQLRVVLFEKLNLPAKKRTATGPSTDVFVLQELADEGHAIPQLLMEYRELFKLEGTYLEALPALVNPETGRIHTSFNQTVAQTGRLSSSDPNLQNIPIRRALGRDIRRGFVPRKGWKLFSADYSQIELRLLAHFSEDPAFVEAFRSGGDIHRQTARSSSACRSARSRRDAQPRQDHQLRDDLRHRAVRPLAPAQDHERRGAAVHRHVLRALPGREALPGDARRVRQAARLRGDAVQAPPVRARAQGAQLQHPRVRRARGAERADPGLGGGPHQAGDDPHPRAAGPRAAGRAHAPPGARRTRVRGAGARGGRALGAGEARDGGRGRAQRAAAGGDGRGGQLAGGQVGVRAAGAASLGRPQRVTYGTVARRRVVPVPRPAVRCQPASLPADPHPPGSP
jgi:DNA polymerase-1